MKVGIDTYRFQKQTLVPGCSNPSIEVIPISCVIVNCATCDEVSIQTLPGDCEKCFFVKSTCEDQCSSCPPQVVKKCINDGNPCPPCHIANPVTHLCDPICPTKICDPVRDICVDCTTDEQCDGGKKCNAAGECVCPVDKPYEINGRCYACLPGTVLPNCKVCVDGVIVDKTCPGGICDPTTNQCVGCIYDSDCASKGPNHCCKPDKTCGCCFGFVKDAAGNCVQGPKCRPEDCGPCMKCDPILGCIPITCPPGFACSKEANGGLGGCVKICDCNQPNSCGIQQACVKDDSGQFCYCKTCSGPCDPINGCGKGCYCPPTLLTCAVNPCGNSCTKGSDCGPNCGCYNKVCTPCSAIPDCDKCKFALGCGCNELSKCVDIKDKCSPEAVTLSWTKDCTGGGGQTGPGLSRLTANFNKSGCKEIKDNAVNGGYYEGCTFNYSVTESVAGKWYYSPSADKVVEIGTGNSVSITHNTGVFGDNTLMWRVIFEATDGRKVTWQSFNAGTLADADYRTEVVSNVTPSAGGQGSGPCVYKLCPNNPNFSWGGTFSVTNEVVVPVEGKAITATFLRFDGNCAVLKLEGCGTYQADVPMMCGGSPVTVKTDPFSNDACCDLTSPTCDGSGGPCIPSSKEIPLKAEPYFGGDGKNDFRVSPDLSRFSPTELYYITNIVWGGQPNGVLNDLELDASSDTLDTGLSNQFINVSFKDGGCVTLTASGQPCISYSGGVCLDKCTEFTLKLIELGGSAYQIVPSHNFGPKIEYSIVSGASRLVNGAINVSGNAATFIIDTSVPDTSKIIIKGKYAGSEECSDSVTVDEEVDCCISALVAVNSATDASIIVSLGSCNGVSDFSAVYTIKRGASTVASNVPVSKSSFIRISGTDYSYSIPGLLEGDVVSGTVTSGSCSYDLSPSKLEQCDLQLTFESDSNCNLVARVPSTKSCACPTGPQFTVVANIADVVGDNMVLGFDYSWAGFPAGMNLNSAIFNAFVTHNSSSTVQNSIQDTISGSSGMRKELITLAPKTGSIASATLHVELSNIQFSNGCTYDPVVMTFVWGANPSGGGVPVLLGSSPTLSKALVPSLGTHSAPYFTFSDSADRISKEGYGILVGSVYESSINLKTSGAYPGADYTVSAKCGCTQIKQKFDLCVAPKLDLLSGGLTGCNAEVAFRFTGCFAFVDVEISVAGNVEVFRTDENGMIDDSMVLTDVTPNEQITLVATYVTAGAGGSCSSNLISITSNPAFLPVVTDPVCDGGTWDIEVTNAVSVTKISGSGTVVDNAINDITSQDTVVFTATDLYGCVSDPITKTFDCTCNPTAVVIPPLIEVCEGLTPKLLLPASSFTPDNLTYEYMLAGADMDFTGEVYAAIPVGGINLPTTLLGPSDPNTMNYIKIREVGETCEFLSSVLSRVNKKATLSENISQKSCAANGLTWSAQVKGTCSGQTPIAVTGGTIELVGLDVDQNTVWNIVGISSSLSSIVVSGCTNSKGCAAADITVHKPALCEQSCTTPNAMLAISTHTAGCDASQVNPEINIELQSPTGSNSSVYMDGVSCLWPTALTIFDYLKFYLTSPYVQQINPGSNVLEVVSITNGASISSKVYRIKLAPGHAGQAYRIDGTFCNCSTIQKTGSFPQTVDCNQPVDPCLTTPLTLSSTGADADVANGGSITYTATCTNCSTIGFLASQGKLPADQISTSAPNQNTRSITVWCGDVSNHNITVGFSATDANNCQKTVYRTVHCLAPVAQPCTQVSILNSQGTTILPCSGGITLMASPLPSGAYYTWYRNNVQVGTGEAYTAIQAGTYKVVAQYSASCITEATITITADACCFSPGISVSSTGVCAGSSETLTATGLSGSGWLYSWRRTGSSNPISTSSSVTVTRTTANQTITLTVSKFGCSPVTVSHTVLAGSGCGPTCPCTGCTTCVGGVCQPKTLNTSGGWSISGGNWVFSGLVTYSDGSKPAGVNASQGSVSYSPGTGQLTVTIPVQTALEPCSGVNVLGSTGTEHLMTVSPGSLIISDGAGCGSYSAPQASFSINATVLGFPCNGSTITVSSLSANCSNCSFPGGQSIAVYQSCAFKATLSVGGSYTFSSIPQGDNVVIVTVGGLSTIAHSCAGN